MPKEATVRIDEADEYSTATVETHPDMWTAVLTRAGRSGGSVSTTRLFVDVGSISHLFASTGIHSDEKRKAQESVPPEPSPT